MKSLRNELKELITHEILNIFTDFVKSTPPDPYSPTFYCWETEFKVTIDTAVSNIMDALDRYDV